MWVLLYPFVEIYLLYKFVEAYSFVDAVLFLILSAGLGFSILALQGRSALVSIQVEIAKGKPLSNKNINQAFTMLAGILFIVPGFISDLFAVLLITPGVRHIFILYFKSKFLKSLQRGKIRFFSNSQSYSEPFSTPERDAKVVDVTPLEVTHKKISYDDES